MANLEVVSVVEEVAVATPGATSGTGGVEVVSLFEEVAVATPGITSGTGGIEVVSLHIEYATIIPAGLLEVTSVTQEVAVHIPIQESNSTYRYWYPSSRDEFSFASTKKLSKLTRPQRHF